MNEEREYDREFHEKLANVMELERTYELAECFYEEAKHYIHSKGLFIGENLNIEVILEFVESLERN
jgi:hypothetical protein